MAELLVERKIGLLLRSVFISGVIVTTSRFVANKKTDIPLMRNSLAWR